MGGPQKEAQMNSSTNTCCCICSAEGILFYVEESIDKMMRGE